MDLIKLLLFVYSVQSAAVINKKDDFGEENFLTSKVDVPRIHQGSGEIHSISGVKKQEPHHDAQELNDLLEKVFNKFMTKDSDSTSGASGKDVKFGSDGKAYVNKQLIPQKKRVVSEQNKKKQDDNLSLEDLSNSVSHLLDSLSKQKKEKDEFKFRNVEQHDEVEKDTKDDAFEKFKKKFYQNFLGDQDDNQVNNKKRQELIFSGKDNHVDGGSNKKRERLNQLYDEIRSATTKHIAEQQEKQNKRERMDLVKKDVLDLLNALQKKEIFTYHDGKFALAEDSKPSLIFNGKDHHSAHSNKDASKLETVKLLIQQLKDLEQQKKDKLDKKEKEVEQKSSDASLKKMEKVFMDAFKREMEKRKLMEQKKREEETKKRSGSLREVLVGLMSKLDEQIKDEKARVAADEKQISQLERQGTSNDASTRSSKKSSLDDELDSILNELKVDKKHDVKRDWHSDPETEKALKGFNIQKKSGRP